MNSPTSQTLLASILILTSLTACGEEEEGSVEVADASFALGSTEDCIQAFESRAFLIQLAEQRAWETPEVEAFCGEVAAVAAAYADDATLTAMTVAGAGALNGESMDTAYFIGVAGYNLSELRGWLGSVRASRAVRPCSREAANILESGSTLPDGFMKSCLEAETGEAYPAPLFRATRSSMGIEDVDGAAAGFGASLLIYNVPGTGTVVAFVAGRLYAQAEPAYGAFVGCGAALGLDDVAESGAFSYVCLGAEY